MITSILSNFRIYLISAKKKLITFDMYDFTLLDCFVD
jgi:hypothetical protein